MLAWMLWLVCGRREPVALAVVWYVIDKDGNRSGPVCARGRCA